MDILDANPGDAFFGSPPRARLWQNGFSSARFVRGGINAYAEEADPSVPTYLESDGD